MAYYAALISLKQTIRRLLTSSQVSILSPSRKILKDANKEVRSYEEVLKRNEEIIISNSSNDKVISLIGQIRDAAYKLEDAIEFHVSNQSESLADESFSQKLFLDLEEVKEEINSFIETGKKIKKMMMEELSKPLPEEDDVVPSITDFGGKNSKMVGLPDVISEFRERLTRGGPKDDTAVLGMAGIGKTRLVGEIFEDPSISSHFDLHVFVTAGLKYRFRKAMLSILAQLNHDINEICTAENEDLAERIRTHLQGKTCLVVLDDIWNSKDLKELKSLLPEDDARIQVLLTTREERVAHHMFYVRHMRFLDEEESWDLLCEKVFGEGNSCPFQLEKFGRKIAENCEGLPLVIVTVANILSKEEKTLEYWKKVAEKENSVFTDAYDEISDILIPSYNYLPQYLKPCFLYMGVFPQSSKIPVSKLVKLWRAEGFLDLYPLRHFEYLAKKCVQRLISSSIILVDQRSSRNWEKVKSCHLHYAYWHLCVKEAGKDKFLLAVNRYPSSFKEGIKSQRRLCIYNNVLFGIKKAHDSMSSISMARSLLCTGLYHQYPVPICFNLKLLRVLDALTIRFYKFPIEVLKLVRLRRLALTYSGKVPGSISKLWNLEHLIVHRHMSINNPFGDSSYLPMEIWNMKKLRHIQVRGSNLPNPCSATLPKLLTLSDVSVNSCSKEILKRTPNLTKLGVQIELTPDVVEPLCCFDHFSHLDYLESLKCVVVNPRPTSQAIASITSFPTYLKKLSLSGFGYPWGSIRTIAKLPILKVLKLRCYAFQGPFWEIHEEEFASLQYLLIEDTDLEHWRSHHLNYCFRSLKQLVLSHCYKLKEIPSRLGTPTFFGLKWIKLIDCPSLGASAEQLQEQHTSFDIIVHSSWNDEKPKS